MQNWRSHPSASRLLPVIIAANLAGCATPAMHFALENLGAETTNRTGSDDIAFRTTVTMHGLGTPSSVGAFITVPSRKLPDLLATPITTGCSRIIEQNFEVDGYDTTEPTPDTRAKNALTALADALDTLIIASARRAQADLQIGLVDLGKSHIGSVTDAPTKTQIATLLNLKKDYSQGSLDALLLPLKVQRDEADKEVGSALETINGLQSRNVLLLNWTEIEEGGLAAAFGEFVSSTAKQRKQRDGYLLVAGLRITTLQMGDDFAVWLKREREFGRTGSDMLFGQTHLVTQQIAARHLLFREEASMERALAASLALSYTQLDAPIAELLREQQLRATAALANSLHASSRGRTQRTGMKIWPYRFWGDTAQAAASHAELKRGKDFSSFYQVRADLATLAGKAKTSSDGGVRCMHMIPEKTDGVRAYDAATRPTTRFCLPLGWKNGSLASFDPNPETWKPDNGYCVDFSKTEPEPVLE